MSTILVIGGIAFVFYKLFNDPEAEASDAWANHRAKQRAESRRKNRKGSKGGKKPGGKSKKMEDDSV